MDASDPHDLRRFLEAQDGTYETALRELQDGAKVSHWMWFVFPQVAGLGPSAMSRGYAIRSRAEAIAYLEHSVLGPRLVACAEALLLHEDRTARQVMGSPDDVKLRSSMTLFAAVAGAGSVYHRVLGRYFAGEPDARTLEFLKPDETKNA